MSRYKSPIPDRWLEYTSVGKQIDVTPFLAFKVPLKDTFFSNVSPEQKFSPSDLIESVPNLSLVIDLTNTQKYYSGNDFLNSGIEYRKIFCPGHQIPPRRLIKKFFRIVDDFVKKTNDSDDKGQVRLIGVHCTHGINRTGFFICSYMINKLGYNSEKAISEFNSARGHDIERENYLNALKEYDSNPLQFQSSECDETSSAYHSDSESAVNDLPGPQKSYRPPYSSESNSYHHPYRPARDYRNRMQDLPFSYGQPYRQNANFYEDYRYPMEENPRWRNNYRSSFVTNSNSSSFEVIDPYFQRTNRTYRNGRNRRY
ncbi:RNA/RNP complex-1-interacting phosphatase homolog [Planococcus citri]|uniref:RNA/RNP complex-1-interacting phosphatase homolog n=1 Tax=Planococcus citri TaxID=170843 RepID=UPI0031FA23DD